MTEKIQGGLSLGEHNLEEWKTFIVVRTAEAVKDVSFLQKSPVLDLEIDDIAQDVLIKFWDILKRRPIASPKAYVQRMIKNAIQDRVRRQRQMPMLPLPLNEDGELYQGHMLFVPDELLQDPQVIDRLEEMWFDRVVACVLTLPSQQKKATLWRFKDLSVDITALEEALERAGINLKIIEQPSTAQEVRRWQSAYAASLQKLLPLAGQNLSHLKNVRQLQSKFMRRKYKEESKRLARRQFAEITQSDFPDQDRFEQFDRLTFLLSKVNPSYRRALELYYGQRLPRREIAVQMGVALRTVDIYLENGMYQLKLFSTREAEHDFVVNLLKDKHRLPDRYYIVLQLRYYEKLSYPEIALRLHIPEGTARSYASRGIEILKQNIHTDCEEEKSRKVMTLFAEIDALPNTLKTTCTLRFIRHLSYHAIATQLNIPIGTAKARIHRGRSVLHITKLEEILLMRTSVKDDDIPFLQETTG